MIGPSFDAGQSTYHRGTRQGPPCRPRQAVARAAKQITRTAGIRSLVYRHLRAAAGALPLGSRSDPVRGRAVALAGLRAAELAFDRRFADPEGTPAEVFGALWDADLLPLHRRPCEAACDQAARLLVRVSPLWLRVRPGLYRLVLGAYQPDKVHEDRAAELQRLQTTDAISGARLGPACPKRDQRSFKFDGAAVPSASAASSGEGTALHDPESSEAGPILVSGLDEVSHACARAAAQRQDVENYRAPNDGDREGRDLPALGSGSRPLTPSAWLRRIPKTKHTTRIAELLTRHLPADGLTGSAREVVDRLAGLDGRWTTRRERYGMVRAMEALERRGLLAFEAGAWRLPDLVPHPALADHGVAPAPELRGPSERLAGRLVKQGINPAGLSHTEAVALHRRLWARPRRSLEGAVQDRTWLGAVRGAIDPGERQLPVSPEDAPRPAGVTYRLAARPVDGAPPAAHDRRPMADATGRKWAMLGDAVERVWGAQARYNLEVSGGLAGELLDLIRNTEVEVISTAMDRALEGRAPRVRIGVVLAKALREAIAEEGRRLPTNDQAIGNNTPYMHTLATLWAQIEAETPASCP